MTIHLHEPSFDPLSLSEDERVAFYGLLFAMSAADGSMDKDELELIYGAIDTEGLRPPARRKVEGFVVTPPAVDELLLDLAASSDAVRYGAMMHLVDVASADEQVHERERALIERARLALAIDEEKVAAIEEFTRVAREVRERGLDDRHGRDMLKRAAAALTAASVPIAAASFSGTIVGMSAAGLTSGLAALGLGAGVLPGLGVAVLLGVAVYLGAARVLDVGGRRQGIRRRLERERRTEVMRANLTSAVATVQARLDELGRSGDAAERGVLERRLQSLKSLLHRRRRDPSGPL